MAIFGMFACGVCSGMRRVVKNFEGRIKNYFPLVGDAVVSEVSELILERSALSDHGVRQGGMALNRTAKLPLLRTFAARWAPRHSRSLSKRPLFSYVIKLA